MSGTLVWPSSRISNQENRPDLLLHATQSERERLAISCKIDDISVDRY